MGKDIIVQFVCFETSLDSAAFISRWEDYTHSANSNSDVTLQQSLNNGNFRYIAQHRSTDGELEFIFSRHRKPSRTPEIEIKTKQAGGFSILQFERKNDLHADESKVFAFLISPQTDLNIYTKLSLNGKLNIYQAYYENCRYAYILEFFVKNKFVDQLIDDLKQNGAAEIGIFKECDLQAA